MHGATYEVLALLGEESGCRRCYKILFIEVALAAYKFDLLDRIRNNPESGLFGRITDLLGRNSLNLKV
jgi:hypothetical protein